MAQLTWKNIETNFGSGDSARRSSGTALVGGFDPLREALTEIEAKQKAAAASNEIRKSLSIGDPEVFQEAMRRGVFDITPENYQHFENRIGQLLTEQKTRQDLRAGEQNMTLAEQQEARAQETHGAEQKTREITDQGQILNNEQARFNLDKNIRELELAEKRLMLQPEAAKRVAAIRNFAITDPIAAQRLMAESGTQELLAGADWTPEQIQNLSANLFQMSEVGRQEEKSAYTTSQEKRLRPGAEQIADLTQAKTGQGLIEDIAVKDRETLKRERTETEEDRTYDIEQKALAVFEELKKGRHAGSLEGLYQAARDYPNLDPAVRMKLESTIAAAAGAYANRPQQDIIDEMMAANPDAVTGPRMQYDYGAVAPQIRSAAGSILGTGLDTGPYGGFAKLADQTESGGDARTLFGYSQKPGGAFEGMDVTTKTLSQLDQFARSEYGPWVESKIGRTATPMGRFQIVNTTLQAAARELGLDPETTVFDEATQAKIFQHLVDKRLSGPRSLENKLTGLRQEWEGFKNVDDATLTQAIAQYETGDTTGLTDIVTNGTGSLIQTPTQSGFQPTPMAPVDETFGEAGVAFIHEKANQKDPLNIQDLQIINDQSKEYTQQAAIVTDALTVSDVFKGNSGNLLAAMQNPEIVRKSEAEVAKELEAAYGEIRGGQMTDEINYVVDKYGMAPGVAAAFIENAPEETLYINPFREDRHIDRGKVDELVSQYYDLDIKDPALRARGALEEMQNIRAKTMGADEIKALEAQVRELTAEVINIADRKRSNPKIDDKTPLRKLELVEKRLAAKLEELDKAVSTPPSEQTTKGYGAWFGNLFN